MSTKETQNVVGQEPTVQQSQASNEENENLAKERERLQSLHNNAKMVGFIDAIKLAFKNFYKIKGRATRAEYWWYYLFCNVVIVLLYALMIMSFDANAEGVMMFIVIIEIALLITSFTLTIRRLHDIDHSGWYILITVIPLIGGLILLVDLCNDGTIGDNKYGKDPKINE